MSKYGDAYNKDPNSPESKQFVRSLENQAMHNALHNALGSKRADRIWDQMKIYLEHALQRHGVLFQTRSNDPRFMAAVEAYALETSPTLKNRTGKWMDLSHAQQEIWVRKYMQITDPRRIYIDNYPTE